MSRPFAVQDLPAKAFPIEITIYGRKGEVIFETTVEKPTPGTRAVVPIPGFGPGNAPLVKFKYGDGQTYTTLWTGDGEPAS